MTALRKKVISLTLLQIFGTVGILMFVFNPLIKLVLLLIFWKLTFGKMTVEEYLIFVVASTAMTLSQILTPISHLFYFSTANFFTIPWYEIVMWGFYTLSAYRLIGAHKQFSASSIIFLVLLSASFLFFNESHLSLLLASTFVLLLLFLHAHTKLDFAYALYFLLLAFIIEWTGHAASLWTYPNITSAPHIFGIMPMWSIGFWVGSGILLGRIAVPLAHKFVAYFLPKFTSK